MVDDQGNQRGGSMSKRIEYIDIARGIGILLVVMGHNDVQLVSPYLHKLIYSFHMPLFFFMSGLFFKSNQPFLQLVQRRYSAVLKPYITAVLMIFVISLSFSNVSLALATSRLFKATYANAFYLDWVQLWFLPHLFAINIFSCGFYWLVTRSRLPWLKWGLLLAILVTGVLMIDKFLSFSINLLGRSFTLSGLPFSLDLILVSSFFFILGCEIFKFDLKNILSNPLTLIVSGFGLLGMVSFLPQEMDFAARVYDSLPINTIEALLGIAFILSLSWQIERLPFLSSIFQYVGNATLIILVFHLPIQESWGQKMMAVFNNQTLSYWIAYAAGVLIPLFINHYIIQPNPVVKSWFGQSSVPSSPVETPVS